MGRTDRSNIVIPAGRERIYAFVASTTVIAEERLSTSSSFRNVAATSSPCSTATGGQIDRFGQVCRAHHDHHQRHGQQEPPVDQCPDDLGAVPTERAVRVGRSTSQPRGSDRHQHTPDGRERVRRVRDHRD